MKPSARVQACIEILKGVERSKIPMDSMTGDYMRARRYIGSKDRADIAGRVYAIVRHYARLFWWLQKTKAPDAPRQFVIAYLALAEGTDLKRFQDLFDGARFAPPVLNEQEKALIEALAGQEMEHAEMPESVRFECPPQHEEVLRNYFGEDFAAEMKAMMAPAALDLRVNAFLASREKVQQSLHADKIETAPTPYSPWGLRAKEKIFLSKSKAFHKGWVDIQDEGSQLISLVCGAKPGMQVLDYCAGGGGKTLALAAAMERKGRIVAMDTDERRLEKGRARFKKAKLSDIIEVRPLSDEKHRKWLRRQKETFDVVLADVPCSGSGTWRRNPDTRWKTYGPGLEELVKVQAEILDKIAPCVKKGGRLVYATCSLFPAENEEQVAAFLQRHPEFRVAPVSLPPHPTAASLADARQAFISLPPLGGGVGGGDLVQKYMRLTPHRHGTDGFFAAILQKTDLC